jgi:hypothetical protein
MTQTAMGQRKKQKEEDYFDEEVEDDIIVSLEFEVD